MLWPSDQTKNDADKEKGMVGSDVIKKESYIVRTSPVS